MLRTRVMPCLLLKGSRLVKTVRFKKPIYVGAPVNIIRIFNELEVDELVLLDIGATPSNAPIQLDVIESLANECFMPLTYGGGIRTVDDVSRVFGLGVEKCVINTQSFGDSNLIGEVAKRFGSQSIVVAIDVKMTMFGSYRVCSRSGTVKHKQDPVTWAKQVEENGAGEILLTAIDREGTFGGYDVDLIRAVSESVSIPVIANGGASCIDDFRQAVFTGKASAVAAGSMVVYQGKNRAVLTNFPTRKELKQALEP